MSEHIDFSSWMDLLRARKAAQKTLSFQKAICEAQHEYRTISPKDFTWCDIGFYEDLSERMTRAGYVLLGDIENITLSRQFPDMRSFQRVLIGDEGKVMAEIYHIKIQGQTWAMLHGTSPQDIYSIGLDTEFSDGTFLGTNNMKGFHLSECPIFTEYRYDPSKSFEELHASHHREMERIASERNLKIIQTQTLDDLLATYKRMHLIKSVYKREHGYLSREQLIDMAGGNLTDRQAIFADEYEKLQMKDRRNRGTQIVESSRNEGEADIIGAIQQLCRARLELCREHNEEDAEAYRQRGDMNRYLIYLEKHGWSIPFILSDYVKANQLIVAQDKHNEIVEDYYESIGEPLERPPDSFVGFDMLLGRTDFAHQKMSEFDIWISDPKQCEYTLWPSLELAAALVFTGKEELFLPVEQKIEKGFHRIAECSNYDKKTVECLMQIVRAEHLFWRGDIAGIQEIAKTLMETITKTPSKCFKDWSSDSDFAMSYDKSYYEAFAWFCMFLTTMPRDYEKLERAATMIMYCALENYQFDSAETFCIKSYEIITQMLACKDADLKEFRDRFPVFAEFLASVADKYRI